MQIRRRVVPVAVASLALLTSCGGDGGSGSTNGPDATSSDAGQGAVDLVAPVVGGGEIDLADYEGRPFALWFWAPT